MALAVVSLMVARDSRGVGSASVEAEQAAVDRGLAFLNENRTHLDATSDLSALVVLDYLQRKYGLPTELAIASTYDGRAHADRWRTWRRFAGDATPVDPEALGSLTENPGIEEVVVHALHCDVVPLPADYGDLLLRVAARGDYELTHAALALALLRQNGCASQVTLPHDVDARLRDAMLALLDRRPPDARYEELDVRYEALAFLEDFSRERGLGDERFARVLAEQQPGGGWKAEADHEPRMHPTVLAVWALLARLHPDAPVTMFARPRGAQIDYTSRLR